jgi:hypothetical protein
MRVLSRQYVDVLEWSITVIRERQELDGQVRQPMAAARSERRAALEGKPASPRRAGVETADCHFWLGSPGGCLMGAWQPQLSCWTGPQVAFEKNALLPTRRVASGVCGHDRA